MNNAFFVENNIDQRFLSYGDDGMVTVWAPLWEDGLVGGYVFSEDKDNPTDGIYYIDEKTIDSQSIKFKNCPVVITDNLDHPEIASQQEKECTIGRVTEVVKNTNGIKTENTNQWIEKNNHYMVKIAIPKDAFEKIDFNEVGGISNAFVIKKQIGGGIYNGIEYSKEITEIEVGHIALVNKPRYKPCQNLIKNSMTINQKEDNNLNIVETLKELHNKFDSLQAVLNAEKEEEKKNEEEKEEKKEEKFNMNQSVDVGNDESMTIKELVNFYKTNSKKNSEEKEDKEEKKKEEESAKNSTSKIMNNYYEKEVSSEPSFKKVSSISNFSNPAEMRRILSNK